MFAVSDLDELGQRKSAAHILHDALLAWEAGVRDVEHEKPIIDVHRALDFLCFGHHAQTTSCSSNVNDTWTAAQQIAWAYAMTAGAADITTVQEFFEQAHTLQEASIPQEACAWVNPNDAVAVNTVEARLKSTQTTEDPPWFEGEETDLTMVELGKRRMDRGTHIMLPTLGQLITTTTDVAVDQSYENRGARQRRIEASTRKATLLCDFNCRSGDRGVRGDSLVFWGPHVDNASHNALSDAGREGHYLPYPRLTVSLFEPQSPR